MKKSKFKEWFIAQHGERPSNLETNELREDYMCAHFKMVEARNIMIECAKYDARETSALYAWQAAKK